MLLVLILVPLQVLSLCDPVHIAPQVLLQLLLLPQLLEVTACFGLLTLLGELPEGMGTCGTR